MNILIIEDEWALSEVLIELLKQQNFAVDHAADGLSGEDRAMSGIYDLIMLDIMLPKKNGIEVLKTLREEGVSTPILLLTAKSEIEDKIEGLDAGADDYLTKPFSTGELLARVRAMTRRKGDVSPDEIHLGNTVLDKNTMELRCSNASVRLGFKEFQIMEMMIQNAHQVIQKERFIEKIWGYDSEAEYNTIEVYVSFLRKKLNIIQADIQIKTLRGVGYALETLA